MEFLLKTKDSLVTCIEYSTGTSNQTICYISLVRPHLEYACQVWDPYTQRNIDQLEKVQKYAIRICTGQWNTGYGDLLGAFQLPRLSSRQEYIPTLGNRFSNSIPHHFYFSPDPIQSYFKQPHDITCLHDSLCTYNCISPIFHSSNNFSLEQFA